jgi:hypothetical protein
VIAIAGGGGGMVVLVRLVLSCFVDLAALLEARVVRLPFELSVWRKGEDALHRFPDTSVSSFLHRKR